MCSVCMCMCVCVCVFCLFFFFFFFFFFGEKNWHFYSFQLSQVQHTRPAAWATAECTSLRSLLWPKHSTTLSELTACPWKCQPFYRRFSTWMKKMSRRTERSCRKFSATCTLLWCWQEMIRFVASGGPCSKCLRMLWVLWWVLAVWLGCWCVARLCACVVCICVFVWCVCMFVCVCVCVVYVYMYMWDLISFLFNKNTQITTGDSSSTSNGSFPKSEWIEIITFSDRTAPANLAFVVGFWEMKQNKYFSSFYFFCFFFLLFVG